jgi:DNA-directed RNA polymerase subunit RPC12/RpoP
MQKHPKCPRCKVKLKKGIAIEQTFSGMPDFLSSKDVVTLSLGGSGKVINCWKCPKCGYSIMGDPRILDELYKIVKGKRK